MKKYHLMFQEEPLSDEEINRYQNFDNLLKKRKQLLATRRIRHLALYGAALVALLLIGGVTYYQFWAPDPDKVAAVDTLNPFRTIIKTQQMEVSKPAEQPQPTLEEKTPVTHKEAHKSQRVPAESVVTSEVKTPPAGTKKAAKKAVAPLPTVEKEAIPSASNFSEAEPVEGYPALYEYFKQMLHYPEQAKKDSITGSVLVGFSINKTGDAERIHIVKGLREDLDQEAMRLIEQMPLWNPAQLNGKPITTRLVVPLNFQLSELKKVTK